MIRLSAILGFCAAALAAQTLTQGERDRAMSHLHATRKAFLDATAGLTDAQWHFKPSPERWSIAECAEHIAVSEDLLMDTIAGKILKSPPDPEKKALVQGKDELVLKVIPDRSKKVQAPEALLPKSRWAKRAELITHFKARRDRNIAFVQTTQEDLRSHFADHPAVKTLDAYQWILLMSAHCERHTLQLNEVKTHPDYPK
jgi:hypothetical protein